jgi:hypothetical protein
LSDVTSPQPLPPHQDPSFNNDIGKVTMIEYVTTLIAQLDRRFDTLHEDLKDSIIRRFDGVARSAAEADLRYQQRFDAQTKAVEAAFVSHSEAVRAALAAADKATAAALAAAEKAVSKAEASTEKRFESMNEFRGQLADQANTFIPRIEAEQRIQALSDKLDIVRTATSERSGRSAGLNAGWVYLLGAVAAIGTVISIVIATRPT